MDAIDVIAQWQSLFCYHGADEDESDPYLWTIGVVFDGATITHQPDSPTLTGAPACHFSPGSHGNLGGSVGIGGSLTIPPEVGRFETTLQPIELNIAGTTHPVPGALVLVAILNEANGNTDDSVEAGHRAINELVQTQMAQFVAGLNLADVFAAATKAQQAGTDLFAAIESVFLGKLQALGDEISQSAQAVVTQAVKAQMTGLSALPGILDPDQPMGNVIEYYTADQLDPLRNSNRLDLTQTIDDAPPGAPMESGTYAYNLHGQFWRPVEITYTPVTNAVLPGRWQITGVERKISSGHKQYIGGVGGTFSDGTPWLLDNATAINMIKAGTHSFFVVGNNGVTADVTVDPNPQNPNFPFLTTVADNVPSDNLTALPAAIVQIGQIQNVPG